MDQQPCITISCIFGVAAEALDLFKPLLVMIGTPLIVFVAINVILDVTGLRRRVDIPYFEAPLESKPVSFGISFEDMTDEDEDLRQLPATCPQCGGRISPENVQWIRRNAAKCFYCGSILYAAEVKAT